MNGHCYAATVIHSTFISTTILSVVVASAGVASAKDKPSDHAKAVGRVGVSWFGVSEIALGVDGAVAVAPALGIRYWITEAVGIDAGIGLGWSTTSSENEFAGETTTDDGPSTLALLFHVGVPLALYHDSHYTFILVPEVNVGYANSSLTDDETNVENSQNGLRLDVGSRLGAEIHFGFIGVPSLSLEASVGVFLQHVNVSAERQEGDVRLSRLSQSRTSVATTVTNDPWDIFRTSVSARYYF